jgi:integrase
MGGPDLIAKKAKLDPAVRLHDVRHGYASELARQSVPLVTVSSLLGHSSASFTATQYEHSFKFMGEAAAALLNDAIEGGS